MMWRQTIRAIASVLLAAGAARAQMNLLSDGGFDAYAPGTPGPWEFRYGHKGGDVPAVRPRWQCLPDVDDERADLGRHLALRKDGAAAGTVLIGQRVRIPDPLPVLELGVYYRAFCSTDDRSGIVSLVGYTPELWDRLARTPEAATETVIPGDVFQFEIKPQGPDQTEWAYGRAPAAELRAALDPRRGTDVVVAVSFLTWHETSDEWARFDAVSLGDPVPHIDPAGWPRYMFRGEPLVLRVDASSRSAAPGFVVEHRPAGSGAPWSAVRMAALDGGLWEATVPGEATGRAIDVRARSTREEEGLVTEIRSVKPTDRPQHPNLFYTLDELRRMREKIDRYDWAKRVFDGIRRSADEWLEREFAPQPISGFWWHHYNCADCGTRLAMEGPRRHVCRTCDKVWDTDILHGVYWSKVHGDHAAATRNLALTYRMTGDERYARRAVEFLSWYADHFAEFPGGDKGGKVVSQTLDECVWLLTMMEGADLVYDVMTPEEARRIEENLIRAGATYTRKYRGGIHNIRCWHNACWASAGYFLGDPELVAFARDDRYGFVAQMKEGVLEDGMWYERSMGYHSYTISAILYHLKAAMHAGDDLYAMPQVRNMLTFPVKIAFPNLVTPSLNDGGYTTGRIGPSRLELAAAWYDDPLAISAMRMLYDRGASRASMEAWQFGEELPEGAAYTPPPSMDLPGAGLAVLRAGTGDDAACVMVEYGDHGGGHGHPDKLQLIAYGLGRQLMPDPGTVGYANPLHPNFYKTTPGHNTVTVGGRNMAPRSGELVALDIRDTHSATVVRTDQVYDGFVLTRRLLLAEGFLVDEFIVQGNREETLDWFLRCDGDLAPDATMQPVTEEPLSAPYRYLKDARGMSVDGDWTAVWTLPAPEDGAEPGRVLLTLKGSPGTNVLRAKAPGPAGSGQQWDTLRVRRQGAETRFTAVHRFVAGGTRPLPVSFGEGTVAVGNATVELPADPTAVPVLR